MIKKFIIFMLKFVYLLIAVANKRFCVTLLAVMIDATVQSYVSMSERLCVLVHCCIRVAHVHACMHCKRGLYFLLQINIL